MMGVHDFIILKQDLVKYINLSQKLSLWVVLKDVLHLIILSVLLKC